MKRLRGQAMNDPLHETVQKLESELDRFLGDTQWINLGGGYLFDKDSTNQAAFDEAVGSLKSRHGLEVFMEPGSAFVRDAGFLVSTVLDMFENTGKSIEFNSGKLGQGSRGFGIETDIETQILGRDGISHVAD